jgi:AraC-like DNA-binding protein
MVFEFKVDGEGGLMNAFAKVTGATLHDRVLTLPETLGEGQIIGFDLGERIRMMVHQYQLKEELVFRRIGAAEEKGSIALTFHNVFPQKGIQPHKLLPSVQVSADLDFVTVFPAHTLVNTIVIAVDTALIRELLHQEEVPDLLQGIVSGEQPYLYEEIISPVMQQVAAAVLVADVQEPLRDFYLQLKAQELIYLFFAALLKREQSPVYPMNGADVAMMYQVRNRIITDLSITPDLPDLAHFAGMSESKMQRLFRQIFGNSIYNYYQVLRIHEAAYLIKEQRLSVSEAGYRLGFTNMSHFTRMFERHIGMKPKKYALS